MAANAGKDTQREEAEKMQEANATGAGQNEQGRAAFTTGSTTGGGSNFGQGSHHLGSESYRQGDTANAGSNYSNEADRLGSSSTGTSNEGRSSATAGAAQSGHAADQADSGTARDSDTDTSAMENRGQSKEGGSELQEGDRREATGLEHTTHLDTDNTTGNRRAQTGSWSNSSEAENNNS